MNLNRDDSFYRDFIIWFIPINGLVPIEPKLDVTALTTNDISIPPFEVNILRKLFQIGTL